MPTPILDMLERLGAAGNGGTFWEELTPTGRQSFMCSSKSASHIAKQYLITRLKAIVSPDLVADASPGAIFEGYHRLQNVDLHLAHSGAVQWAFAPELFARAMGKLLVGKDVTGLSISSLKNEADDVAVPVVTDALLNALLPSCGSLKQLCISGFAGTFGPAPLAPLAHCLQLASLELYLNENMTAAAIASMPVLPALQSLIISKLRDVEFAVDLASKMPRLMSLKIDGCEHDGNALAASISGLTCLSNLHLLGKYRFSEGNINALVRNLPSLRELTVPRGLLLLSNSATDGLPCLPCLQQLNVAAVKPLEHLELPLSLPALTSLAFTSPYKVSAVHFEQMMAAASNLARLVLCPPLHDRAWTCSNLQRIRDSTKHVEQVFVTCYSLLEVQDIHLLCDWPTGHAVAFDVKTNVDDFEVAAVEAALHQSLSRVFCIMLGAQLTSVLSAEGILRLCHNLPHMLTLMVHQSVEPAKLEELITMWCLPTNPVRSHKLHLSLHRWPQSVIDQLNTQIESYGRTDLKFDRGCWFTNMVLDAIGTV